MLNLQKKLSTTELEAQLREQDLTQSLAESHSREKKLKDDLHSLEMKLQEANRTGESLQMRLSSCEGRTHGLDIELAKAEAAKREVELKLVALHSTLRRTLGLGSRSPSPQRSSSPVKGQNAPRIRFIQLWAKLQQRGKNNEQSHHPWVLKGKRAPLIGHH